MEPLDWSRYAGLKLRWVKNNEIAVSPMPRQEDLDRITGVFRTVVSLATPAEFIYGGHLDPRMLQQAVEKHIWLVVGEYNAPTLVELSRGVAEGASTPVLVHCMRGCGRSPMFAAAWLLRYKATRITESLTLVAEKAGCSIETMPQKSVVEAYDVALRIGMTDLHERYDADDPRPEYALLLARSLAWLTRVKPEDLAEKAMEERGATWPAAELLASRLSYSVAGFRVDKIGADFKLVVVVWIPRRAHPASVRRAANVPPSLEKELEDALASFIGVKIDVVFDVRPPGDVPWV